MTNNILQEAEKTVSIFGQMLAKTLGTYRIVECPTCLTNNSIKMKFLEITIPDAGNIYVALGNYDYISKDMPVIPLDSPPQSIKLDQLIGWLQGYTPAN